MSRPKPEITAVGIVVPSISSRVPVSAKSTPPTAIAESCNTAVPPASSVMPCSVPSYSTVSVPPLLTVVLLATLR